MRYLYNGVDITHSAWQHDNGTTFTAGAIRFLSEQELSALGVTMDNTHELTPVAPEPQYKTTYTPLEFLELFTEQEQLAVVSATLANAPVKLWYDKLLSALEVNIEDERLISGMGQLVTAGLLTQDRVTEILTQALME